MTLMLWAFLVGVVWAGECEDAKALTRAGEFDAALLPAQQCLASDPGSIEAWMLLARVLGGLGEVEQAIGWAERAETAAPHDADVTLLLARLHAWRGDFDRAHGSLRAVHDADLYAEPASTRLPADLAYWAHDWQRAVDAYDAYLDRWPDSLASDAAAHRNRGLALQELGETERAVADFERACSLAGDCALVQAHREQKSRFTLFLGPGYVIVPDRGDGFDLFGMLEARLVHTLKFGVSARALGRDFGGRLASDVFLQAHASWKADFGLLLYAAGGFTVPDVTFSPTWSFQIEPGWAFKVGEVGLEARLKWWHLQFASGDADVISPAVTAYWRAWWASLRYWLTIDGRPAPGHAAIGKIGVRIVGQWHPYIGAGGGDRADYLDFRERDVDRFWLLTAGLAFDPHWRHRIQFDWVYRNEVSNETDGTSDVYREHLLRAGYRVRF